MTIEVRPAAPADGADLGEIHAAGWGEILGFYGHPDGWGSGIAAALMTGTLRLLRDNEFTRAHLWTVRDTAQSRRFYTKCGFTGTGATRTTDFGEGNLLTQVEYERDCPPG